MSGHQVLEMKHAASSANALELQQATPVMLYHGTMDELLLVQNAELSYKPL